MPLGPEFTQIFFDRPVEEHVEERAEQTFEPVCCPFQPIGLLLAHPQPPVGGLP